MSEERRAASIDALATTTRLLVRSGIEIGHALEAMLADGDPLTAEVQFGEKLFLSRILGVDPEKGTFVVACSASREANFALLTSASTTFTCNHRGAHYGFIATAPREVEHEGAVAIRFAFPVALYAHQRREQGRVEAPPRIPLRCEITWGSLSFDAKVVDISLDGFGAIIYDANIYLASGTRLERARIIHPQREPVVVDLDVRHASRVQLRDGTPAIRAGCRFLGAPQDLNDLIRLFVTDLDAKP